MGKIAIVLLTGLALGGCSVSAGADRAIEAGARVCRVTPAVRAAARVLGIVIPPRVSVARGEICDRIGRLAK